MNDRAMTGNISIPVLSNKLLLLDNKRLLNIKDSSGKPGPVSNDLKLTSPDRPTKKRPLEGKEKKSNRKRVRFEEDNTVRKIPSLCTLPERDVIWYTPEEVQQMQRRAHPKSLSGALNSCELRLIERAHRTSNDGFDPEVQKAFLKRWCTGSNGMRGLEMGCSATHRRDRFASMDRAKAVVLGAQHLGEKPENIAAAYSMISRPSKDFARAMGAADEDACRKALHNWQGEEADKGRR